MLVGGFITVIGADEPSSVVGGIVIFAFGILIGIVCILGADWRARSRAQSEWHADGRPERRA